MESVGWILAASLLCLAQSSWQKSLGQYHDAKVNIDLPVTREILKNRQHVRLTVHNERIVGDILVERDNFQGEDLDGELQQVLASCDLQIVDVEKKSEILAELALVQSSTIEEVDFGTMVSIVQACEDLQSQRVLPGLVPGQNETASGHVNMWTLLKGIVPGTKWCGMNDLADNYHDLAQGSNFLVDKCCRAHDHCPVKVHSFGSNYGITNYHPYTKSHCACDDIFYDCLKEIASSIVPSGKASAQMATTMGQIYFNVLQLECAEPNYPKVCLHTTKALPGSKGHGMQREKVVPQKRFFWDIFGSSQYSPESKEIEDWQEICTQWVNDTDATPTLSFRNPKRLF